LFSLLPRQYINLCVSTSISILQSKVSFIKPLIFALAAQNWYLEPSVLRGWTEYNLKKQQHIFYIMAIVLFTGRGEAQASLQRFSTLLRGEAEQGRIAHALESKLLGKSYIHLVPLWLFKYYCFAWNIRVIERVKYLSWNIKRGLEQALTLCCHYKEKLIYFLS
jgi:hypothetical protein